ncbi:MAG: C39 family peptidase [Bacilli bacterium]|nr:C39 family peptidase [Bacilli bacterium]
MIKSKTILFLLLISIFMLVACNTKKEEENVLDEFVSTIVFEESLTEDLNLQTEYNYKNNKITVNWESSNTNVLSNEGKYYYTLSDEMVTLSALFTCGDESINKYYDFISYANEDKAFEEAFSFLHLPDQTDVSLKFYDSIKYGKTTYRVSYISSNPDIISNDGKIRLALYNLPVIFTVTLSASGKSKTFLHDITVLKVDTAKILENLQTACNNIGYDITHDINFPKSFDYKGMDIDIEWESKNPRILSNDGIISPDNEDTIVTIVAKSIFNISYTYKVNVKAMNEELALEKAMKEIEIPKVITSDINLETEFKYNTKGTWVSSDQNTISNDGVISKTQNTFKTITYTLTLSKGESTMEKEFETQVSYQAHFFNDRTFKGEKSNVHIENEKLVLDEGKTEGYYQTDEVSLNNILSVVGSYAATSSKNATCELLVRVKSNNKWSKYFSYGKWGQGLNNSCLAQSDTYVKMVEDEIKLISPNTGEGFQLKLILRRTNATYESPKVTMIALAIEMSNYTYNVDISNLPKEVKYDVPKLYQHEVPSIGGIICSATSSTMLLKYKGYDFSDKATYEHEYIAGIVLDHGNNIYGNWVYNTIGMSSFGETAYVKRFYSYEEMLHCIATTGPIAASIKGTTITNIRTYTTAGHLIVVTGYKIEGSNITIYVNDPNIVGVAVEMTLQNFLNVYRMVSYVIE